MESLSIAQLALRLALAVAVVVWGWSVHPFQQLATGIAGGLLLLTAVKPHSRVAALLDVLAVSILQVYDAVWLPLSAWVIVTHRRYGRSVSLLLLLAPAVYAWQMNGDFVWWAVLSGVVWLYLGFTLAETEATHDIDEQFLLPLPDELRDQWEQEREAHRQLRYQYQELVSAHRELQAERQIVRARLQMLRVAIESDEALRQLLNVLRECTGAKEAALWVYDEQSHRLQLAHATITQGIPITIQIAPLTRSRGKQQVTQADAEELRSSLQAFSSRVLPFLLYDNKGIVGAVALIEWKGSDDEAAIRERFQQVRDTLFEALRVLLQHRALQQENKKLKVLYEISRLILDAQSVEDLSQKFVTAVEDLSSAPFVTLYLRDRENGDFEMVAYIGEPIRLFDEDEPENRVGLPQWLTERTQPLYLPNTSTEPRLIRYASKRVFASLLGVPLTVRDQVQGVLLVAHPTPGYFDEHHIEALVSATNQFTHVLTKAQFTRSVGLLALTDGLTGLYNRRYMELRLEEEIRRSQRYGKPFSVVLVDVDHFKRLNDTWGHATGDVVLQEVSRALGENVRETELIFRYGGEEFLILLPETPLLPAIQVAQRLRESIQKRLFRTFDGSTTLRVTLSAGVAEYPTHGSDKSALLAAADEALYIAKQRGRNRVEVLPSAA